MDLKSEKARVKEVLTYLPEMRESDNKLYAHIIFNHIGPEKILKMSAFELLEEIEKGRVPHFETIRRNRAELQKKEPRGNRRIYNRGA